MISHSVIAVAVAMRSGCPARHPSPQEFVRSKDGDDGFFALLGKDGDLDLALLDVEDGIRRVALREDRFILAKFGEASPPADFGEEILRIKYGCTRQKGRPAICSSRPSGGLYHAAHASPAAGQNCTVCTDLLKADAPSARIAEPGSFPLFWGYRAISSNLRCAEFKGLGWARTLARKPVVLVR